MLEFSEAVLSSVRRLQRETHESILSGGIRDMEQYRFLMGRLEGFRFVEEAVKELLSKNPNL
jgi:hypothetical protein